MRWVVALPFALLALSAPLAPARAQSKPDARDTVTLKDPGAIKKKPKKADDQGVATLKPDTSKQKPKKTDDQGVATLKDGKADKVEKLFDAKQAQDAKRRKKVEQAVEASRKKQKAAAEDKPKLLPFEEKKAEHKPGPTLVPFEQQQNKKK